MVVTNSPPLSQASTITSIIWAVVAPRALFIASFTMLARRWISVRYAWAFSVVWKLLQPQAVSILPLPFINSSSMKILLLPG